MGAGHVRQSGLRLNDRGRRLLRVDAAQRAVRQSGDGAALLGDGDELAVVALQFVPADVHPHLAVIGTAHLEQQAVGERRCPAGQHDLVRRKTVAHERLRRHGLPSVVPRPPLLLEEHGQLVLRVDLVGDAAVRALLQDIEHTPLARVGHIGPGVDVAGVEVLEDARDVVLVVLESRRGVEPDLILGNRAAERRVDVVRLLQRIRRRQAACLEILGIVVALKRGVGAGGEDRRAEGVAAIPWNVVHADAAGDLLGRAGGVVDRHFLGAAHIGSEVGAVPGPEDVPDGYAVDRRPLIFRAAAVNRDERVLQIVRAADVAQAARAERHHPRDEDRQVDEAAPGRNGRDDVGGDRALLFRALDVDERRFAGDRDRLGDVANPEVGVHRGHERPGQLDAFPLDGIEPGQRKRHGVGAGTKVHDLVLPGRVGHNRPNAFDRAPGLRPRPSRRAIWRPTCP